MPSIPVTLQINMAPTDARHVGEILPHQLRRFGDQVDDILVVIDLNKGPSVDRRDWTTGEVTLRRVIEQWQERYPHLRSLDVDTSPEVAHSVADEFFGGEPIPEKDWRGAPVYAYFYGLWASRNDYILHMDADMLYGGGGQKWIAEGVELLRCKQDVLACSPLPGPPTLDGRLRSQTLPREPFTSLAFRADQLSTRVLMIDRNRFRQRVNALTLVRPSWHKVSLARLDGYPGCETAEGMLTEGMVRSGLSRIDFLGSDPGMWSLHPPYRSPLFYEQLPALVKRIEAGEVPEMQRGRHDVDDTMLDWSSARKSRWHRLSRHLHLAVRNLRATHA